MRNSTILLFLKFSFPARWQINQDHARYDKPPQKPGLLTDPSNVPHDRSLPCAELRICSVGAKPRLLPDWRADMLACFAGKGKNTFWLGKQHNRNKASHVPQPAEMDLKEIASKKCA